MKNDLPKINFKDLYKIYTKKYPELFKLQERQRFVGYLYLTLTLFTISFFGIFAILPTLSTISTLRKQYSDNQLVYDNLKIKLANLQTLESLYQQNSAQILLVDEAIPQTAQIPSLVRKIETLAQQNGLFISRIEVGTVEYFPTIKNNPPLYSFTVDMKLSGNSESINQFISQAINFDRIMGIDTIASGTSDGNNSEVSITGRVFFYAKK